MIGEHAESGGAREQQLIELGVDQHLAALHAGLRDGLVIAEKQSERQSE